MMTRRFLIALVLLATPAASFAGGVDAIVVIPLYVVLFVLSMISFGTVRKAAKPGMSVLVAGVLVMLNWAFSFYIYLDWLANAIDDLGFALLVAAISPFLIVQVANVLIRGSE